MSEATAPNGRSAGYTSLTLRGISASGVGVVIAVGAPVLHLPHVGLYISVPVGCDILVLDTSAEGKP